MQKQSLQIQYLSYYQFSYNLPLLKQHIHYNIIANRKQRQNLTNYTKKINNLHIFTSNIDITNKNHKKFDKNNCQNTHSLQSRKAKKLSCKNITKKDNLKPKSLIIFFI